MSISDIYKKLVLRCTVGILLLSHMVASLEVVVAPKLVLSSCILNGLFFFTGPSNDTTSIPASCSTSVAITAVVSCAVSFIIAALVGAVVHYCTVRKKCDCQKFYSLTIARKQQQQQQPAPVYDDIVGQSQNIELKENVAYGPVQQ